MKGSINYRKDRGYFYVQWHNASQNKTYKIYKYKGEFMYNRKIAEKLLAVMQGDFENGTFQIEKFTENRWTDVVPYLWQWLDIVKPRLSPATYKDYRNSIKNHLTPFFKANPVQLHEIQYDVLMKLLNSINRKGKGKANVMYCLHRCFDFAYRSRRIPEIPPFPEKADYNIQVPTIKWIPENRQLSIINEIPGIHKPIFLWLKYHLRRPSEAMALYKEDYDFDNDLFIIKRTISARQLIERTKTSVEHLIPCHSDFKPIINQMAKREIQIMSPFFFTCHSSRMPGKRYTQTIMSKLWKDACKRAGESISMYAGLKHSSCSQYINQKGLSISDLQTITDHARLESVKRYAKTEVARKRQLLESKIVPLKNLGVAGG